MVSRGIVKTPYSAIACLSQSTSEWTLDYPPFFAYFEYVLSQFAKLVDPRIVRIDNLEYDSTACLYFQRLTVIISELVLVYALSRYVMFRNHVLRGQDQEQTPCESFAFLTRSHNRRSHSFPIQRVPTRNTNPLVGHDERCADAISIPFRFIALFQTYILVPRTGLCAISVTYYRFHKEVTIY
jgi:hypothetical protein